MNLDLSNLIDFREGIPSNLMIGYLHINWLRINIKVCQKVYFDISVLMKQNSIILSHIVYSKLMDINTQPFIKDIDNRGVGKMSENGGFGNICLKID